MATLLHSLAGAPGHAAPRTTQHRQQIACTGALAHPRAHHAPRLYYRAFSRAASAPCSLACHAVPPSGKSAPATTAADAPPVAAADSSIDAPAQALVPAAGAASMQQRYEQAYTMSQLYAQGDRPAAIPLAEHERRRKVKDMQEVVDAGRRRGMAEARVREGLAELEMLLPGVLNLHRMKPADWASVAGDVNGVAHRLILLKAAWPRADVSKMVAKRPKTLLAKPEVLEADAEKVKRLLASAPNPDAILEALPDLLDPVGLARSLAYLSGAFPGQDPVALLQRNPDIIHNLGEATNENNPDYGEWSTKD